MGRKNGVYVYLMPLAYYNRDQAKELAKFPQLTRMLAKRYKDATNVLFGLWAEPSLPWDQWRPTAERIADGIVAEKPNAVILMTGWGFGRHVNYSDTLPHANIVYDYHDYPAANPTELKPILAEKETPFIWGDAYKRYPILIGEFGGVYENGFGGPEDLAYIMRVLDEANRNGLNYSAYTIDDVPYTSPDSKSTDLHGLGLIDWNTRQPTRKGDIIKRDLEKFPPTRFLD